MVKAESDAWAAKFEAAPPGTQFDLDRAFITGLGFTILAEDPASGSTKVFAHGKGPAVDTFRKDTNNQCRIPTLFFLIPKGTEITESLIRKWVPRGDAIF